MRMMTNVNNDDDDGGKVLLIITWWYTDCESYASRNHCKVYCDEVDDGYEKTMKMVIQWKKLHSFTFLSISINFKGFMNI